MPIEADTARILARLGGAQEGTVRRSELLAAGLPRHAIDNRTRNGHLHRIHRGVYIVGHTALAPYASERAALLACGEGAVLSHWSAAYLWGLTKEAPSEVHVTLIGRHCRPKQGVRIHRASRLERADLRRRRQIPLTSAARTAIDLAAESTYDQLASLVAEARVLRLIRDGQLEGALDRAGQRPGVAAMRAFLSGEGEPVLTRSAAERRMFNLARAAGLPRPLANARVEGWEVDFYWPARRLIVEVDGYEFHGHRHAFERDGRKGLALAAAGYVVIRISARQLLTEPVFVAAQLATALANAS